MSEPKRSLPSGDQFEIRSSEHRAVVTEVGAGLRLYSVFGRDVLDGYGEEEMCTGARGAALIPWPNRLEDGRYTFGGETLQTPLTEPERHNAIHGLTRWMNWSALEHAADRVRMGLVLHPQPGYPFILVLEIEYRVGPQGLLVRTTAANPGNRPLPYGAGHHPYLTVGTALIDDASLHIPAASTLELDGRRNATGGTLTVAGTEFDFRSPRPIGQARLDTAYAELDREPDGVARVAMVGPGGRPHVELWMDRTYPYLMAFTGDSLADPARRRRGLGLEPMTCAPNAFRTGACLQVLAPGETSVSA